MHGGEEKKSEWGGDEKDEDGSLGIFLYGEGNGGGGGGSNKNGDRIISEWKWKKANEGGWGNEGTEVE
jgi:hypothetical protein